MTIRPSHATERKLPAAVHFTEEACVVLADMASAFEADYLKLYERYPLADGMRDISVCMAATGADAAALLEHLRRGRLNFADIGWLIFLPSFVRAAEKKGLTARQYADQLYDQCLACNAELGFRAAWIEAYGEIGNSVAWPKDRLFAKHEALAFFRAYLRDGRMNTEHWGRPTPPEMMNYYTHALTRGKSLRDLPVSYTDGTLFALPEAFRLGFPLVVYEAFCGTMDPPQLGTAFVRGGAKMADAFWGVDFSSWECGPLGNDSRCNAVGGWQAGIPDDHLSRCWLAAYLSGCNTLLHELGYGFYYAQPTADLIIPSDYGQRAMQFYALTRGPLADRGKAIAPFAILLEEAHGYRGGMQRTADADGRLAGKLEAHCRTPDERLFIWSGVTGAATRGDWAVHRLFRALWPWSRTVWGQYYAAAWPDNGLQPYPWTEVDSIVQRAQVGEIDPREYCRFAYDSQWADCCDVVTETADAEALCRYYRVLWLAGDVCATEKLWPKLAAFLQRGGVVVAAPEHLGEPARAALGLGLAATPTLKFVNAARGGNGDQWFVGEYLPLFAPEQLPAGCVPWAVDPDSQLPLALEIPVGAGRLYLLLASHALAADAGRLSGVAARLMDRLYAQEVGVLRHGPPCQMLVNGRTHDTLVTLLNHTKQDWHGEIEVRCAGKPSIEEVREVLSDAIFPARLVRRTDDAVIVTVRIPSFGTRLISLGAKREPLPIRRDGYNILSAEDRDALKRIVARDPQAFLGT